ncbi:MAG: TetR/AcrR family transcriptional regulator [Lachnospiraceae bacterium]|nr:TetR/AcrR family transcriptional regulator [Lachnospiraceae bacterium]
MGNLFSKNYNKRTRFTRVCIGEAIFSLMDKKEYRDIKISDIVKRAGVSRMTFYHYYETKEEALADFFHEIVAGYIRECVSEKERVGEFHGLSSIVHALQYFDRYASFILKLVDAKLYYIVIDAMNAYMKNRIMPRYKIPVYELYFYGGALLNVFIMWELNGKKETAEEIAGMVAGSLGASGK